ncbi:MAG: ribonuclease H-like domain-containing protein [Velocimicrobium sp.]
MLTIKHTFHINKNTIFSDFLSEDVVLFDIETTGFSPDISSLYLIGCLYRNNNCWNLVQWFADDYQSEKDLLIHFFEFLSSFHIIVHYNGSGFDIPYLLNKCRKYKLSYDFSIIKSMDLYKEFSYLKSLLGLPNLKQKTIENFLGVNRTDPYDGGELISVYSSYMQHKILSKPVKEELDTLLLHNEEDLLGLLSSSLLMHYKNFFKGSFTVSNAAIIGDTFHLGLTPDYVLAHSFHLEQTYYSISFTNNITYIDIPITKAALKHFYKNYKDYYYLPQEDTAIHKSVAAYVDNSYRQKAKAHNCYTLKAGMFLPQFKESFSPVFQTNYKSKPLYFELTDSFCNDPALLKAYLIGLFNK